jgi:oxalate decarboxylase
MAPMSFRYQLEKQPPKAFNGGITRGASVVEFPASIGIAGVSMQLAPGTIRELHWHANAAEWAYVIEGNCRTTILAPDGTSAIDTFGPGDVWYFPRGFGHSIQGIGPGTCHFILIFDNGDFSEDHTFSVSDFLAQMPPAVVAQALSLTPAQVGALPKKEVYFAQGPVPDDASSISTSRSTAQLTSAHRYPLLAQEPRRIPGGGTQRVVTVDEFPISTHMAGSLIELEPGGLRDLHWHPNADEWQYFISGRAEMGVFLAEGQKVIDQYDAGDIGYVPMGAGHYIKNIGDDLCRILVGFNSGHYQAIDVTGWLAANPLDVLETNLGIPEELAARLPRQGKFIIPAERPGS